MIRRRRQGAATGAGGAARGTAVAVLLDVLREGRSLGASLRARIDSRLEPRDAALARELASGTLRYLPRLDAWLASVMPRKPRDRVIHVLALLGVYQVMFTRVPVHAAVSSTVELARALGKPWAAGFLNAILRRFAAERESIERMELPPSARLAHPDWLLQALEQAWPDAWERIARSNLDRAPMTLRVNVRRISRRRYLERLSRAGIPARATRNSGEGITLDSPRSAESVPGFDEGLVSIQDEAAQLAAALLDARAGNRVLDACAAPGGKTAHVLERGADGIDVLALDVDPNRTADLRSALARLGLAARVQVADASKPATWWDGRPFHRILVDAPCSGTGVIRRHPDIKVLRRPGDIDAMTRRQTAMLLELWPLLARGGRLLYATCSVLSRENESIIRNFLAEHAGAEALSIDAPWGHPTGHGRQILPGEDAMDGFFYAALAKH